MARKKSNDRGFTLVELIVVIVIILILAALAVPSITRYVQKSKIAKCANQRHELETQFYIMETDIPEVALCTLTSEVESLLGGDILKYMVENGYCSQDITVCPVYNEKYVVELISTESGEPQVEFVCSCVDKVKGYVSLCEKYCAEITGGKYNQGIGREKVIEMVEKEMGAPFKVSDTLKKNSSFASTDLYWKPYFLNDGKMILYGTTLNPNNSWSSWEASLLYIDGQVYESTNKKSWNGEPDNTKINDLQNVNSNSLKEYLKKKKFEEVSK